VEQKENDEERKVTKTHLKRNRKIQVKNLKDHILFVLIEEEYQEHYFDFPKAEHGNVCAMVSADCFLNSNSFPLLKTIFLISWKV
jgi:hypothetical protein